MRIRRGKNTFRYYNTVARRSDINAMCRAHTSDVTVEIGIRVGSQNHSTTVGNSDSALNNIMHNTNNNMILY